MAAQALCPAQGKSASRSQEHGYCQWHCPKKLFWCWPSIGHLAEFLLWDLQTTGREGRQSERCGSELGRQAGDRDFGATSPNVTDVSQEPGPVLGQLQGHQFLKLCLQRQIDYELQ